MTETSGTAVRNDTSNQEIPEKGSNPEKGMLEKGMEKGSNVENPENGFNLF